MRFDSNLSNTTATRQREKLLRISKVECLNGAPGRTRTCGPLLRRQMLYPLSYGSPEAGARLAMLA